MVSLKRAYREFLRRIQSVHAVIKNAWFAQNTEFKNVQIRGTQSFCWKITESLSVLRDKDSTSFDIVNEHLSLIIQSDTTFLSLGMGGAVLSIEGQEALRSTTTWLASILAYQGFRAKLYNDYKNQHKGLSAVPEDVYSGEKAWDFQYNCLRNIGANYDELEHLSQFVKKQKTAE